MSKLELDFIYMELMMEGCPHVIATKKTEEPEFDMPFNYDGILSVTHYQVSTISQRCL